MTTPLADFLPLVTPFALSVPDPVATHYVRQAAIDFCSRTRAWREVSEFASTGAVSQALTVPAQSSLFEIERAWFRMSNTARWEQLERIPYTEIDQNQLTEAVAENAQAQVISQSGYNTVTILPRTTGFCKVSMFLKPKSDADSLPDFLFADFMTTIADGALSYILLLPEQPFTNPSLAGIKLTMFNQACDAHFARNIRGQHRAPLRLKSSFF